MPRPTPLLLLLLLTSPLRAQSQPTLTLLLPDNAFQPLLRALPEELSFNPTHHLAPPESLADTLHDHPFLPTAKTSPADLATFAQLLDTDLLLSLQPSANHPILRLTHRTSRELLIDTPLILPADPHLAAALIRETISPTKNPADPKRAPLSDPAKEIDYWRTYAPSLMPKSDVADSRTLFEVHTDADRTTARHIICTWEKLLLLSPNDNEATLNLAVSLLSLVFDNLNNNQPRTADHLAIALRASKLAEAAFLQTPSSFNGATYSYFINPLETPLPTRAADMQEFITAHAKDFPPNLAKWARLAILKHHPENIPAALETAVANAATDPDTVAQLFHSYLWGAFNDDLNRRLAIARPYLDHKDPVTRFFANYVTAETCEQLKYPAALTAYDTMRQALDAAYKQLDHSDSQSSLDYLFIKRYETCLILNKPDDARKALTDGSQYFLTAKRFNLAVADTWYRTIFRTNQDDPAIALPLCNAYLAATAKHGDPSGNDHWDQQIQKYKSAHTPRSPNDPH